jgi:hypothetical protein
MEEQEALAGGEGTVSVAGTGTMLHESLLAKMVQTVDQEATGAVEVMEAMPGLVSLSKCT